MALEANEMGVIWSSTMDHSEDEWERERESPGTEPMSEVFRFGALLVLAMGFASWLVLGRLTCSDGWATRARFDRGSELLETRVGVVDPVSSDDIERGFSSSPGRNCVNRRHASLFLTARSSPRAWK